MSKLSRNNELAAAVGSRIKQLREKEGLPQKAFAEQLQLGRTAISNYEQGRQIPDTMVLMQIARRFGTTLDWILSGQEQSIPTAQTLKPIDMTLATLPIVGKVAAGYWRSTDDAIDPEFAETLACPLQPGYPAESQYLIAVEGESMNQLAQNGDILQVVDIFVAGIDVNSLPDEAIVIVRRTRHQFGECETTAKALHKNGDWELRPKSNHPDFQEPIRVKNFTGETEGDESIEVIAIVASIIKPVLPRTR